jgi:hypothetical protein
MQHPLAYILQTLFQHKVFVITPTLNAGSCCSRHFNHGNQSRTQSNACARATKALALEKLNFSCAVIGLSIVHANKEPEPLNLGVPVVNFPRANAFLARAQALLWVRDCMATR